MPYHGEGQNMTENDKISWQIGLKPYVSELQPTSYKPIHTTNSLLWAVLRVLRALEHLELTAILKPQTLRSKGPLKIMQAKESLKLNDSSLLDSGQQGADSALAENVINAIGPVIERGTYSRMGGKDRGTRKSWRNKTGVQTIHKLLISVYVYAYDSYPSVTILIHTSPGCDLQPRCVCERKIILIWSGNLLFLTPTAALGLLKETTPPSQARCLNSLDWNSLPWATV